MTYPVRPAAPRETQYETDDATWLESLAGNIMREGMEFYGRTPMRLRAVAQKLRLAAAPVPCAASPADPWQSLLKALVIAWDGGNFDEWRDACVAARQALGFQLTSEVQEQEAFAAKVERVGCNCYPWEGIHAVDCQSRATGEGARDAMDTNHNGKPAAAGDEPVRGDDAAPDPRRNQGQVAVSLDPHRLLVEEILQRIESAHRGSIGSIGNTYLAQIGVDEVQRWSARLRGEATVQQEG